MSTAHCEQRCDMLKTRRAECADDLCAAIGLRCHSYGAPKTVTDCLEWCCVTDTATLTLVVVVIVILFLCCVGCIAFFSFRSCCRKRVEVHQTIDEDEFEEEIDPESGQKTGNLVRRGEQSSYYEDNRNGTEEAPYDESESMVDAAAPQRRYKRDQNTPADSDLNIRFSESGVGSNDSQRKNRRINSAHTNDFKKDVWEGNNTNRDQEVINNPKPKTPQQQQQQDGRKNTSALYDELDIGNDEFTRRGEYPTSYSPNEGDTTMTRPLRRNDDEEDDEDFAADDTRARRQSSTEFARKPSSAGHSDGASDGIRIRSTKQEEKQLPPAKKVTTTAAPAGGRHGDPWATESFGDQAEMHPFEVDDEYY